MTMTMTVDGGRLGRWPGPAIPRPSDVLGRRPALVAVATTSVLVLGALAKVADGVLLRFDQPVAGWVGAQGWLHVATRVDDLGSEVKGAMLALAMGALLWRRCRALAITYPVAVGAGILLNVGLKLLVGRARPPAPLTPTGLASFPSGHVLHAVILWGLLPPALYVLTRRRWVFWLATAGAATVMVGVGLSRVALAAHWPTDVMASVVLGGVVLLAAERFVAIPTLHPRRPCALHPTPPAAGSPGVDRPPALADVT